MDARECGQPFVCPENFFDHHVKWSDFPSLRSSDEALQALKILCGITQAVDVIEPQALQFAFFDQLLDQAMDGLKSAGILDPQPRQRVDIEETAIIDIA